MKKYYSPSAGVQFFISIVFFILLGIPIYLGMQTKPDNIQKSDPAAIQKSMDLFGFFLEDVHAASGVNFTHQSPRLDKRLDPILAQIASVGASVSICDFDNDGWQDLYFTSSKKGAKNALYKNMQDGSFAEVGVDLGVADINDDATGVSMGAVWADMDNDGYEDLLVYKWGKPILFKNMAGKRFEKLPDQSGLPAWVNANSAIWLDYNNDGKIDLLIGGYFKEDIDLWHLKNTIIMPESFEYANNGGRNYLLENQGDGTFKDVTFAAGIKSTKWTLAMGAVDFNNDGFQDIFIANDYSVDELFINQKGESFTEVGKKAKIGYAPKSGMNVSVADIKNDGKWCVYVSNITEMGILLQGNNLWQISDDGQDISFANTAGAMGVELGGWSYGSQFGDLNNDGYQDLYLANGFISATKNNSYWYDYSKITGGNKSIISDATNWPAMEGRSQSGYQKNKIWVNNGGAVFADVTDYASDLPAYDSRAVAMADLWNRGVLDVIVASQNAPVAILKNHQKSENNWIGIKLEGTKSNRSAIGALATVTWGGKSQTQFVSGGLGFSSENQRNLHFGLGKSASVDKITIHWPSGAIQTLANPEINKLHFIKESNENL